MQIADVIVIGLGAMGSAAAYQAAKSGARVIGIDRFSPPHDQGSTHGESRVTRQAIGEGEIYVPFALRSHEIWREIEAETGDSLFVACGALFLESAGIKARALGKEDFVDRTIQVARRFNIAHEVLGTDEIRARYPQFQLAGETRACFEPGAGLVRPEACVAAQLGLARRHGAMLQTGEIVTAIIPGPSSVRVETDRGTYEGATAIVAAGAWTGGLVPATAGALTIHRQALFWFDVEDPAAFTPERFPVFMWMHGETTDDWFYGFPMLPGARGIKLAAETFADPQANPDAIDRRIKPGEAESLYREHIAGRLAGVRDICIDAKTCLYTATPDHHFTIDRHPESERVLLVSPCSGHGFKHSAAIGEAAAELALSNSCRFDLSPFTIARHHGALTEQPGG